MVSQDDSPESLSLRESSPSPGMDSEAPNPIPSKPKGKKDESKKSSPMNARRRRSIIDSGEMRFRPIKPEKSSSSEDEDIKSAREMGDWINSLPATAPYHRGNVLVVPESPYRQLRNGRAVSAKVPRSPMKHYTELYRDRESPLKGTRKYGLTTEAQKRKSQEQSDLHDELQHQQVQLVREKTGLHHAMHGEQPSARDTLQDIMITKRKIQEAKARQRPKSSPAIKSSSSAGSPAASGRDRGGAGKEEGDLGGPTRMSVESPKMRSMKRPSGSGMASGQRSTKHSPASSKGYRLASAGGVSQHSAASTRPSTSTGGTRADRGGSRGADEGGAAGDARVGQKDGEGDYLDCEFDDDLSDVDEVEGGGSFSSKAGAGGKGGREGRRSSTSKGRGGSSRGSFLGESLDDNNPLLEPYRSKQGYVPSPGAKTTEIMSYPSGGYFTAVRNEREEKEERERVQGVRGRSGDSKLRPNTAPAGGGGGGSMTPIGDGGGYGSLQSSPRTVGGGKAVKVSLDNFEELCVSVGPKGVIPRMTSPHSINAMRTYGATEEDLRPVPPLGQFMEEWERHGHKVKGADEDDKYDRVMQTSEAIRMRHAFSKDTQERIVSKLKEERYRHRNASVVLIPDANTIGYPPAVQLTSYGETARNSYIEQGVHGKKARMEALGFGSSYAEELANSLVEKGRQKVEHLEAMEKKRIAALLKKNIAVKDSLDDLQERIDEKNQNKDRKMQERLDRMKSERMRKVGNNNQRFAQLEENRQRANEMRLQKLVRRHNRAEEIHTENNERIKTIMRQKAIYLKLSRERHKHRMEMANRAQEYKEEQAQEKLQKQQAAMEVISREREKTAQARNDLRRRINDERALVTTLVENFRETGQFSKRDADPSRTTVVSSLISLDTSKIRHYEKDKNPDALMIENNKPVNGHVSRGGYVYYKFRHSQTKNRISVFLTKVKGDPELCVGNNEQPYPTMEVCTWHQSEFGNDKITIHPFDKGFITGVLYVGIYGNVSSSFRLTVRWNEPPAKALSPRPPSSRVGTPGRRSSVTGSRGGRNGRNLLNASGASSSSRPTTSGSASSPGVLRGGGSVAAHRYGGGEGEVSSDDDEEDESPRAGRRRYTAKTQSPGKGGGRGVEEVMDDETEGGGGEESSPLKVNFPDRKTAQELAVMTWEEVVEWLASPGLNIDETVRKTVQEEKVPGSQIATMTLEELVEDLGMSRIQAKRVCLNRVQA